ncbi:SRPBCC family protein [Nocardioides sp. GY 10127]|uniref:SRPBCC family protein n=1 Tax=Nocardioides sp. GY 10127 TaxID=2569762 RepID=UPI0010A7AC73|nr:SRPBCC family protein [Nocardioides sp. GY 10127]TIC80774.1 transcriptional regulator [Nocardioides sp. GY 10127]
MGDFEVSRATTVAADPADVQALVVDFREWRRWSPWEDVDPAMTREYDGPDSGEGASYRWTGNRKAGAGSMRITAVTPDEVAIDLAFTRPMKATNDLAFLVEPVADGTRVTWRMRGRNTGLWSLLARFVPMDRLVGADFEKGLARLKSELEAGVPGA